MGRRRRDKSALLYLSFMRLARAAAIWSSDSSSMWTVLTCFMMSTTKSRSFYSAVQTGGVCAARSIVQALLAVTEDMPHLCSKGPLC